MPEISHINAAKSALLPSLVQSSLPSPAPTSLAYSHCQPYHSDQSALLPSISSHHFASLRNNLDEKLS